MWMWVNRVFETWLCWSTGFKISPRPTNTTIRSIYKILEYLSPRSTLVPPYPSPLASRLLNLDGVSSVFYGSDFITITKSSESNWAHVKPEVFSLITEAVTSGEPIVTIADRPTHSGGERGLHDSLACSDDDTETVSLIKELLETRIRPSIQEDGGDIEFRDFVDGKVYLNLRGACRTCNSSTVTLKNGIESMLMHYVSSGWKIKLLIFLMIFVFRFRRSKVLFRCSTRKRRSQSRSLPSLRRN